MASAWMCPITPQPIIPNRSLLVMPHISLLFRTMLLPQQLVRHGQSGIVSLAKGRDSRDQNRARGRPPTTTHPPSGRGAVGLGDRWLPRLPCDCQRSRLGKTCAATADWFALRARWCESIPVRPTGASSRPASAQSHAPALLPLWGRIRATALPNGPTAREPVRHSRPGKSHWLVPATACAPPASLRL